MERILTGLLEASLADTRDEALNRRLVPALADVFAGDDCRLLAGLRPRLLDGLQDLVFETWIGSGKALGSGLHGLSRDVFLLEIRFGSGQAFGSGLMGLPRDTFLFET